jgi:hypothetical protein
MTTLTIKGELYRIRQRDEKNLIIERQKKTKEAGKEASGWDVVGYYGKIEDLSYALLKLAFTTPKEAKSISEFMDLLGQEIKKAEISIASQLAGRVAPYNASDKEQNASLQPAKEVLL